MPTPTDRLGINKFSAGETDWTHDDLVDAVDELAIDRGPIADRPASGTHPDELYYATDQNVLWGWDETNSQWIIRGGTGSSGQPLDSVATDVSTTGAAGRGTTSQWGPRAQDYRSAPPFPTDWTKSGDNPLITTTATDNNQAAFPSLFHAGRFLSNPIDEWYLYWSGHDGGGIRLHTAPEIEGPWSAYSGNPLFTATDVGGGSHVASPSAIWDPANDRLNLYYHRMANTTQETELATSTDGTSFTFQGTVLVCPLDGSWDEQERSYLKVYRNGQEFIGFYDGRDRENNNKGTGYAWSPDGSVGSWRALDHPWAYNDYIDNYDSRTDQQGPTPSLVDWGGEDYLVMSIGTASNRTLDVVRFDDPEQTEAHATTILTATETWEADSLEGPELYYYNDRLYMFYNSIDTSSSNERKIGLAWTDLEGYQ